MKYLLYLSDEELAKKIGLSVQTVKKYNKQLMKKGIIKLVERNGKIVKQFDL